MNILKELETTKGKVQDFAKRNITALIVLAIAITGIWIFTALQKDTQEKLNDIYSEMQTKQDKIANAIDAKYSQQNIPEELVTSAKKEAISLLTFTPEYMALSSQARKLEATEGEYSPFKAFAISISGLILAAVLSGLILYIMTAIPFTKLLIKGPDGVYSEGERKATIILLMVVFSGSIYLIGEVMKASLK